MANLDVTGTIQEQISQLSNEKVSNAQLQNYVASQLSEDASSWLNTNVDPVGSAVIVDKTLTIEGAAADAKVAGNAISKLSSDLSKAFITQYQIPESSITNLSELSENRIYMFNS